MKNEQFLSIGEFAKYSDRSIQSIRYYEKLGFLEPAYIDPMTNYRYYRHDQIALLEIAQFCTELDIPLNELPELVDEQNRLNSTELLMRARKIAEEKMKIIQKKLSAIELHERQLKQIQNQGLIPNKSEIQMPERYFFTVPYYKIKSILEYRKAILQTFKALNQLDVSDDDVFEFESGIYCEYDGVNIQTSFFVELPFKIEMLGDKVKVVPAGIFESRFSFDSMVDALERGYSYIAIETEVFSDPYDLMQPLWELKILEI